MADAEQAGSGAAEPEERLRAQAEELERLHDAVDTFTYAVTHDLRAPLRTMQGFAYALLEDHAPALDESGQFYVQRILASAQIMDRLIQNVQDHSSMQRMKVRVRPLDLDEVVDEAVKALGETITASSAQLVVHRPFGTVVGHRAMLVKAVIQLLDNAVKFVAPGVRPHVEVFSEPCSKGLRLWVVDNGIGVEPAYADKIFGVFERLHGVESYPGTGIGLALVQVAAERLGGEAGLEPGDEGSRFWLRLPTPTAGF